LFLEYINYNKRSLKFKNHSMSKQKNLSKIDIEDVSTYEVENKFKPVNGNSNGTGNKIRLEDIPIKIKCLNERQKQFKKLIQDNEIVVASGSAGVGKTYLSLLMALHLLKTEPKYKKIILIKSLQVVKGEEVGFLKGTLEEKIAPYAFSFTGNLDKIFGSRNITKALMDSGIIEFMPIAYLRGVTFSDSILIIDEIQNITTDIFKTIVTRIGENSKMIFLGDQEQCDLNNKKDSCIKNIMKIFKDSNVISTIEFSEDDCVRNPLIPKILNILNNKE
jgi:phosphate starvation-inducible protein PhoH and related proteins